MSSSAQRAETTLLRRLGAIFHSRLARAAASLFLGTIAGGVLGYVFQVIMGRMLSTNDYGLFSAMMALFAVFSAPAGTLMMVVSRKVSAYRAKADSGSVFHFYYSVTARTAVTGAVVLGACLVFAPQVRPYLKAPSIVPVYLLGALLFFTFLPIVNDAFLQGLQKFNWLSASNMLRVLLKILFAVALVWLGFGVAGAIGGTILAALIGWVITYAALRRPLGEGRGMPFQTAHLSLRPALPVLVANTAFAAMTQLDMVLVNYYFAAHEAGLYAAASILGKAVMYLPGGIAMALFPMVAENQARDHSSSYLFIQAVVLTGALCGFGALFYFAFGERLLVLLYGEEYRAAGPVLRYFGFAILPMALVMVAEYFLIAKGRVLFAYLFMLTAPLQILAFYLWHGSLLTVVAIVAASSAVLAVVGYAMLWRLFRAGEREAAKR